MMKNLCLAKILAKFLSIVKNDGKFSAHPGRWEIIANLHSIQSLFWPQNIETLFCSTFLVFGSPKNFSTESFACSKLIKSFRFWKVKFSSSNLKKKVTFVVLNICKIPFNHHEKMIENARKFSAHPGHIRFSWSGIHHQKTCLSST